MNALRLRTLRRAAALAALLALAALPHGHLRGHEAIADALASAQVAAASVSAETGSDTPGHGCTLCLSLAHVKNALVHGPAVALPVAEPAARLVAVAAPRAHEAPGLASSAPRAPPLV